MKQNQVVDFTSDIFDSLNALQGVNRGGEGGEGWWFLRDMMEGEKLNIVIFFYIGASVKLVFFRFADFLPEGIDARATEDTEDDCLLFEQTNCRVLMAHLISP